LADRLVKIVADYFTELRNAHGLGAGTPERSYYTAVANLLNAIGDDLKGKVHCLPDLENTGAGHPDFGLFAASQVQRGKPRSGQMPERGAIEMKPVADDAWPKAKTEQISRYFETYRLVIVTNLRDFLIIGEEPESGRAARREHFRLAKDAASFWALVSTPRKSAEAVGRGFGEYLKRALTQSVALREPKDLAWFLASYARDALERVEAKKELPGLASIKSALEEALGMKFEADKGEHFFRSTLVQTLFYGVFSSWVLWARQKPAPAGRFEWQKAIWHLNVPFVSALFQQLATPKQLKPLDLVELLDWTEATLNRVAKEEFLQKFNDADAVQFFYEPFLEAFDPDLRKELGVWYTPSEVVAYMVARVDKALKEDLGVADGLASDNVYVLDPCCGTGAYVAAVLRRIDRTFAEKGYGGLRGQMVKKAALERVLGFEIMPAPFIVAHLQVGSVLQGLGAGLKEDHERASVYLTNALTGWEPTVTKPLPFPGLEEERKKADKLKQEAPILVILGNPPYNGYAGITIGEERDLTTAYRETKGGLRKPEGQGLNDLYVRFFRMAERRIVDKTGRGIVCFISNYSWLDGLSFTGMRQRYLEVFDAIRIDCLNGDKYKTGKTTPDGKPDPSIFSTEHNREGIQVGTAIATLIRESAHKPSTAVGFRHLWGTAKQQDLLSSAETVPADLYKPVPPPLELGLPFIAAGVVKGYFEWPKLPELLSSSFPGVKTSRDDFLIAIDREELDQRLDEYFDPKISDDAIRARYPAVMNPSGRFDPAKTRQTLLKRGKIPSHIVRYAYRPFDVRWVYWEPETKLLDEKRSEYWPHVAPTNVFLSAGERNRKEVFYQPQIVRALADHHLVESNVALLPLEVNGGNGAWRPNLPQPLLDHIAVNKLRPSDVFNHIVAILHAPTYHRENAGALRMDWPRVPLPNNPARLASSSKLGALVTALLDSETPASGVSVELRPGLKVMGIPTKRGGKSLEVDDLALTVRWGAIQNAGGGRRIVMPGPGLTYERDYTVAERAALAEEGKVFSLGIDAVLALLGKTTLDVHLSENAWWSNVPTRVWDYMLGGYPVIKKWLSYRDQTVLGRVLKPDEAAYVSEMVRRVAGILLMGPSLDSNYAASKAAVMEWPPASAAG
jgi:hypothetical protein